MDINELKTFVKVVQTGSFTNAADALSSHKAQVSRTISNLEKKLNTQLLQRSTRALHLTEIGREVYERALSIVGAIDDTQNMLVSYKNQPTGTLRITCGVEFGMTAVNAWIAQYLLRYPNTQINADYTSRVVDIIHEGFDIAIRVGQLAESNLVARKIGELQYGLFASTDYIRQYGSPQTIEELQQHQLLTFSVGQQKTGWLLQKDKSTQSIEFTSRLAVNNRYALLDATRNHLGIASLPLLMTKNTQLQRVLPDYSPETAPIHAVFASTRYLAPKVRAFIDLAIEMFV